MRSVKCLFLLLICMFVVPYTQAADKVEFTTAPVTNNGERWRIGYFEGGEYTDYQKILIETVKGLMKLGWIEKSEIPEQQGEQTAQFWQWLQHGIRSEYIEFVPDAHYTAQWDETIRSQLKRGRKLALVVEGSHFMSRLYQDSLRPLPIEISVIEDGLDALGWLLREKYDLVIMGAETKSLNGTALLYALRAAGGINRDIKTIMVTSREKSQFAKGMQPDTLLTKNQTLSKELHDTVSALFTP